MSLTTFQQFHEAINRARTVLVLCRASASVDEVSTALALGELLRQSGKQADIVSDGFVAPQSLKFIPEITSVKSHIGQLHQFLIKLSVGDHGVESVHHELVGNELVVTVTPKSGVFTKELIHTASTEFKYDLIVTVGAQDLASLGAVYTQNTALFDAVPLLAIDHSPANEYFGHMNYVDVTLTSNAEVIYSLFATSAQHEIKPAIANMLLTGMIAATQSFKTRHVNARTLQTASALIALGADRELIVHHLYRQRSVATLKLWGAALTHVQTDPQLPLMWSSLTREDFARAGASEQDLSALIDELISTAPSAKVFALIYERPSNPDELVVIVDAQKPHNADILMSGYTHTHGTPERVTATLTGTTLGETLQKISNVLRIKMRT